MRMAMPESTDRDARGEIEIAVARVVPHLSAVAAHDRQRRARVILHDVRVVELGGVRANNGGTVHRSEKPLLRANRTLLKRTLDSVHHSSLELAAIGVRCRYAQPWTISVPMP